MSDLYLLSASVNGTETFYTANIGGVITSIGTTIDWSKGFSKEVLSAIDNSVYSTMKDPKVYTNNVNTAGITEETAGGGLLWSTYATAINCKGYAGLTSLTATGGAANKYAITFGNVGEPDVFYTRGTGTLASTTTSIPTTAAARTTAGITVTTGTENLFDGTTASNYTVSPSTNTEIDIVYTTAIVPRRYSLSMGTNTRLPMTLIFEGYDPAKAAWVALDTITVKAAKTIDRYFNNSVSFNSCRLRIQYDVTAFGDDPTKNLVLTKFDVYGQTTGTTWISCTKSQVATIGMTASVLNALGQSDYALLFDQSQINWVTYIPDGSSLTSIVAKFPANAAPIITNVIADRTSIHSGAVVLSFNITDPEGSACSYVIKVDGKEVTEGINVASGSQCTVTLPNSAFTTVDDPKTDTVEANTVTIMAEDDYGASSSTDYAITKIDKLPTYVGILKDNVYTFSIADADNDKVKYEAFLNGKSIGSMDFTDVPISNQAIKLQTKDILIGKENSLKIVLTDAVGGTTIIEEAFVGEYRGLIFFDENGTCLSTDIGEVLKKLVCSDIICGQTTLATEVTAWNKSTTGMSSVSITGPGDINGTDTKNYSNGVYIGTTHTTGDIFVQLSLTDEFSNDDYNSINLPALAANEKTIFYVRVVSTNRSSNGGTFDFTVNGIATT